MIAVSELLRLSYDKTDECEFGTSHRFVRDEFNNRFRSQFGLCRFDLTATHLSGTLGFGESKGLYMCEAYVSIPFYGQTVKALIKRLKRIQKLLDADLAKHSY